MSGFGGSAASAISVECRSPLRVKSEPVLGSLVWEFTCDYRLPLGPTPRQSMRCRIGEFD